MTRHANLRKHLSQSRARRLRAVALAAILGAACASTGWAQGDEAKPAQQATDSQQAGEAAGKVVHGYTVHQSLEVGGRITNSYGSGSMWATLFNYASGGRILGQSLEMRSVNPAKTPFFDTLTTYSTGYGGDPMDVTRLNLSKGRIYDFAGSFRRDRNYFDYNLLDNSLLGPGALVPENSSLHVFNTVRRNTDANLTLLPLSRFSFHAGFNHNTNEGPSYTSVHEGADAQLLQWFRNAGDTYTGGATFKLARATSLSYDQFFVLYRGDSTFQLAGANYTLSNGQPVSLGVDTLSATTCGTGANKTLEVVNGVANPYCNGFLAMSQVAPTRTLFPTEQFRFSSRYWDKVAMNGRLLYSGATGNVNHFNETYDGLTSRTATRAEIDTGGFANGQLANLKRINVNGDYSVEAEFNKYISASETFNYWSFRSSGTNSVTSTVYTDTQAQPSMLDPLSGITPTSTTEENSGFLNQKIFMNTAVLSATVLPQLKLSAGWRYRSRTIGDPHTLNERWNENTALVGGVFQPSPAFRLNVNFETMRSGYASGSAINGEATGTPALEQADTFTRIAPNTSYRASLRATMIPAKWLTFSVTGSSYQGKNTDPLVNHLEQSQDFSFTTTIRAAEQLTMDFSFAYDDVYAHTDLCYIYTGTPVLSGGGNSGTCVQSALNPLGSASLFLGQGTYDAPASFFGGSIVYTPLRRLRLNAGTQLNSVNGQAEQLNPYMVPGALQSLYLMPYGDVMFNIAPQWSWHGNFVYDGYAEQGPLGMLAPRNVHGNMTTLSVKYAF